MSFVFSRSELDAEGFARNSALMLGGADGSARALTPHVDGVLDSGGNWSPDGTHVVFERRGSGPRSEHLLLVADLRGRLTRLVPGRGPWTAPAWGPDGRIAFIGARGALRCVWVTDRDGSHPRELFCPANAQEIQRPVWSADGQALFVASGYYSGRIEPVWHAAAWRVDGDTGAAVQLGAGDMDESRAMTFSPDGTRAILSDPYPTEMLLLDFTTGDTSPLPVGCFPRWSPDGARIAYTGEVYEDPPDFRYYQPLYVMDRDGNGARRITTARVDNRIYAAAAWSRDGVRVLVNRTDFTDPSLTRRVTALRTINVDSGVVDLLAEGFAEPGGWFER